MSSIPELIALLQQARGPAQVAQQGLGAAKQFMGATNPAASAPSRAFAGAGLAGQGAQAAGALAGAPALAELGRGLGTVGGLASAGYGIYNTATNPDLSTSQKIGHSGRAATDAVMSMVPVVGPFYGAARALSIGGEKMEGSGSPQVRGAGRAIGHVAEPSGAKAFWDVIQGDRSPAAAFKAQGGLQGAMLDTMGPVGAILRGVGMDLPFLGSKPTQGTQYRNALKGAFNKEKIQLKDWDAYNIDPAKFDSYDPRAREAATQLGQMFAGKWKKNPEAYAGQTQNLLMNNMTPEEILALAQKYQGPTNG